MKKSQKLSILNKVLGLVSCIVFLVIVSGCASTKVVEQNKIVTEILPKPSKIYVYDFIANPQDIPKGTSILAKAAEESPVMSKENIKIGRKLGASIAEQLVIDINNLGLSAELGSKKSMPKPNDIIIRGYLVSINQGNAAARFAIGLGMGGSSISTVVEGFQMTDQGIRKLGEAKLQAGSNKTPGGGIGALTFIAGGNPLGLIIGEPLRDTES